MTIERKHDEVTIRMTDTAQGVDLLVFDQYIRRHLVLPGVMSSEVPTKKVAEIHRRKSWAISRRN